MDRTFVATALLSGAGLVFAVLAWPSPESAPPVRLSATSLERRVTVHVSGGVARPGLVELPADSRIADAIVAAGGAVSRADLGSVNLAAPIGDGGLLVVPLVQHQANPVSAAADGRIRVNTATARELEQLPGVGPVLAGLIVAFRDASGPFARPGDLLAVPGIGEAKLAAIAESVLIP